MGKNTDRVVPGRLKVTTQEETEDIGQWVDTSTAIVSNPADIDMPLGKNRKLIIEETE